LTIEVSFANLFTGSIYGYPTKIIAFLVTLFNLVWKKEEKKESCRISQLKSLIK
jgi:hypothetical protein